MVSKYSEIYNCMTILDYHMLHRKILYSRIVRSFHVGEAQTGQGSPEDVGPCPQEEVRRTTSMQARAIVALTFNTPLHNEQCCSVLYWWH